MQRIEKTCKKCGGSSFRLKGGDLFAKNGESFDLIYIRCDDCKELLGSFNYILANWA